MLSITKVVTTGLSIAFLPELGLDRIIATVIGVIIIVIQGFLVIALLILITLGAISTWMSLTRNREEFGVEILEGTRVRYFLSLEKKAPDEYVAKPSKKGKEKAQSDPASLEPKEPYFEVQAVRRAPKIEDEDGDVVPDMEVKPGGSGAADPAHPRTISRQSRPGSSNSFYSGSSLPRAARAHRASWSSRDFAQWEAQMDRPGSSLAQRLSGTPTGDDSGSTPNIAPLVTPTESPAGGSSSRANTPTGIGSGGPTSPLSPVHVGKPSRESLRRHAGERRSTIGAVPSRSNLRFESRVDDE
jgi:hypothetical protein